MIPFHPRNVEAGIVYARTSLVDDIAKSLPGRNRETKLETDLLGASCILHAVVSKLAPRGSIVRVGCHVDEETQNLVVSVDLHNPIPGAISIDGLRYEYQKPNSPILLVGIDFGEIHSLKPSYFIKKDIKRLVEFPNISLGDTLNAQMKERNLKNRVSISSLTYRTDGEFTARISRR